LDDTAKALEDAKARYHLDPALATCDFSASMIGALGAVFGDQVIGIDGFHVMQLLNNGIRRDLLDFRDQRFKSESRELIALRGWVCKIQKMVDEKVAFPLALASTGALPVVDSSHGSSLSCSRFTTALIDLLKMDTASSFFNAFTKFLDRKEDDPNEFIRSFVNDMRSAIPSRRVTDKGMDRVKGTILKKLKVMYLAFRAVLDAESVEFAKDHWVVFFQPEKVKGERKERLERFLNRYPALRVYREMTLQVGAIYRLPVEKIDGHEIAGLEIKPFFSEKLKTAIQTLKDHAAQIYRFVDVFKLHPGLPKRCRASMEWYNPRFKTPFKKGNNLLNKGHVMTRLQMQLHGHVEWRVPASTGV
jgi:hypothetical protein